MPSWPAATWPAWSGGRTAATRCASAAATSCLTSAAAIRQRCENSSGAWRNRAEGERRGPGRRSWPRPAAPPATAALLPHGLEGGGPLVQLVQHGHGGVVDQLVRLQLALLAQQLPHVGDGHAFHHRHHLQREIGRAS